ncbi:MAG TPA: ATP-binding cassette domain-containing protein [Ktedonobacteraceae bacterium]|nr:ATP-binding cassette domain-containing protein [Ktedonobacteraceae bacterium]
MRSMMRETNDTTSVHAFAAQYSDAVADRSQSADGKDTLSVNLHHHLGAFQLAINFQVPLGLIVLLGSSGAGKSLTLRGIAGLLHAQQGQVVVNGQVLFDSAAGIHVPTQLRHIGYVPQHYALFPHLTVAENVLFALPPLPKRVSWRHWSKQRAVRRTRLAELLSILELEGLERRYPATLSGGQQQRVALARALAAEPRLLLLDEPFNALDAAVRERLRDTLQQFHRRFAIPIVLVTHDHAEAQQLADTIVVVQRGQVAQTGSVNDIFYAPRTPDVAQLVGQHNVFTALLATPPDQQKFAPQVALHVETIEPSRLQPSSMSSQHNENYWLPLPGADVQGSGLGQATAPTKDYEPVNQVEPPIIGAVACPTSGPISGCIRTDEVVIHRWSGSNVPALWTAQGSAQWVGILQEAQLYGHMVRLLIHPYLPGLLSKDNAAPIAENVLEVYLSRGQWRDVEVAPGQQLVLEIPSKAIHVFERLPD